MEMKRVSYEEYEQLLVGMYEQVKNAGFSEVIAVMRKGMMAAYYLSYRLEVPCGVYYPQDTTLLRRTKEGSILFVDDSISLGRTFDGLAFFMDSNFPSINWKFFPVFIDSAYTIKDSRILDSYRPTDWFVAPWSQWKEATEGYKHYTDTGSRKYARDSIALKEGV